MRFARKLMLLAVMAIAAMAMMAGSASAQSVEISQEGGAHCSAVSLVEAHQATGGCYVHATSVGDIVLEAFGEPVASCSNEYDARISEGGQGYIYNQVLDSHIDDCTVEVCKETSGAHIGQPREWAIEVTEGGPTDFELEARFCVDSAILGRVDCHIENVDVIVAGHSASFDLFQNPCENSPWTFVHVTGQYELEAADIEIEHAL